ncbi:19563_t:CDS:1, partial [Gigaspora margarita]
EDSQNSKTKYFKIGRGKDVEKRLKQWEKKCKYEANLLQKFPTGYRCKYTHRVERLIHLELSNIKISLPPCSGCKEIHKEWFDAELISNTNGSGLETIKKVIQNWINYCDQ